MAGLCIYTGVEALKLREAATAGTWAPVRLLGGPAVTTSHNGYVIASVDNTGGTGAADAALIAAAPDLAASVVHHEARARRAEAEVGDARSTLTEWEHLGIERERRLSAANARADKAEAEADKARRLLYDEERRIERERWDMKAKIEAAVFVAQTEGLPQLMAVEAQRDAAIARAEAAEASDRQASETCADLRRQLLVMTAERDALRAAGVAVLEAWKVTEAQAADGACWQCGATIGKQHDDLCDMWEDAAREARAALKAAMVPHE